MPPGRSIPTRSTSSVAVQVCPPYEAESVTVVEGRTGKVVTGNIAIVIPAGTVTVGGTAATPGFALASWTTAPPGRAGSRSVTRPVVGRPPGTTGNAISREPG